MGRTIHFLQIAVVTLLLLIGNPYVCQAIPEQQNAFWGMMVSDDRGGSGIEITAIRNCNSPAGYSLQIGDVIQVINGVPVRTVQEFNAVKNSFPLYVPLELTVKRNNTIIKCPIILEGRKPLEVKPIKPEFVIPGVPPAPLNVPTVLERLDQINVLEQVILEPKTGELAVIGHYDARYNTGPIPYLDLLKTAMTYPKPKLNLHHSKEASQTLHSEKNKLWEWDAKDFVLGHPDVEQERQLLIEAWSAACGLTPQELVTLYNYAYFGDKQLVPPPEISAIQRKLFQNLGYAKVAQAYELVNQGGSEAALKALELLGQATEGRMILSRNNSDSAKAQGLLTAAAYFAIMENIYAPVSAIDTLREGLEQGQLGWQEAVKQAQSSLIPFRSSTDKREIVNVALNKIQLTETGTKAISRNPLTGLVNIESIDIDANSQLNRILYEADYSLKSVKAVPHLFWNISGSLSEQEYSIAKNLLNTQMGTRSTDFWLEPKAVALTVSPDRRVIDFGAAQMNYKSNTYFDNPEAAKNHRDISRDYDDWCAGVMNHYDEYAAILPAFHKVREAAKVIALANWLLGEKLPVNLSQVAQEKWNTPQQVPGFWRASFIYYDAKNNGSYELYRTDGVSYTGGVTFKNQGNWTQISAGSPQTETKVADQLTVSAALGQKAVEAAQSGSMENARYFAELSAQAMTGKLSSAELAKANISAGQSKLAAVSPANVQLQKEMIKQTYQQITDLNRGTVSKEDAAAKLARLSSIYSQVQNNPISASDYLLQLQTGKLPTATIPNTQPSANQPAVAKQPEEGSCVSGNLAKQEMTPERRAYYSKRLQETRNNLEYIQKALRRIAELNAKDTQQLEALTYEISRAYEKAWDRVADLAVDVALDRIFWHDKKAFEKVTRQYEEELSYINNNIKYWIGRKSITTDTQALKDINNELNSLYGNKYLLQEMYVNNKKLHEWGQLGGKGIQYTRDVADVSEEKDFMERVKLGFVKGVGIALDLPGAEKVWKGIKLFGGVELETAAGWWTYGQYIVNYAGDIACQRLGWGPQVKQLTGNLEANRKAILELSAKARALQDEATCLEDHLR